MEAALTRATKVLLINVIFSFGNFISEMEHKLPFSIGT